MWILFKKKHNIASSLGGLFVFLTYFKSTETRKILLSLPLAGLDPIGGTVYSALGPSSCEEWQLLVDQADQSHQRAVVIKNKQSGRFLAVQGGRLVGAASYSEDCKWILV